MDRKGLRRIIFAIDSFRFRARQAALRTWLHEGRRRHDSMQHWCSHPVDDVYLLPGSRIRPVNVDLPVWGAIIPRFDFSSSILPPLALMTK
jgi:hypothetical protein